VGGAWAALAGSDADDFTVGSGTCSRPINVATPDTNLDTGRYIVSGVAAFGAQVVELSMWRDAATTGDMRLGVLSRVTDINNWLLGHFLFPTLGFDPVYLCVTMRTTAGGVAELGRVTVSSNNATFMSAGASDKSILRLEVSATGVWALYWSRGGSFSEVLRGSEPALMPGGTLATGKPGFYHAKSSGASSTVFVDDFLSWAPTPDAVVFPSQSCELATDQISREDATGVSSGPVSWVERDLPRVPTSGPEARPVQVMVKASRGDLDAAPDTGIDDVSVQGFYRPCWLFVPDDSFNPLDVAGCELWLRPERLGADGTSVALWADSSGASNDAAQSTAGLQPLVVTGAIDGYRVARFDGAGDALPVAALTASDATRTIYVVARAAATGGSVWGFGSAARLNPNDSANWGYVNNAAAGTTFLPGAPLTWQLVSLRYNSVSSTDGWVNGGNATNFDPDDSYQTGGAGFVVGNRNGGGANFNGDIVELLMFNSGVGTTNHNLIRGYFSRKYPTLGSFGT